MEVFKFGKEVTQTLKNVGRFKTILTVMARHGFAEIIDRMNLRPYLLRWERKKMKSEQEKLTTGERLRLCFEELGPTFIKLGQLLSTRPDLVPQDIVLELQKLQDRVPAEKFSIVEKNVANELGAPLNKLFKFFDHESLAAASMAQVHRAILQDGTEVAVKVQRPGLERIFSADLQLLEIIANLLQKYVPETAPFNPRGIVREFSKHLYLEVNFLIEANNMRRVAENFKDDPNIVVPKVYKELTTARVLTTERLEGIPFSDRLSLEKSQCDIKKILHVGVQAFYKMVFLDGLFHGDLHAGNLFVLSGEKIGLVDFGIVGHLSQKQRDRLSNMFLALISEDYDTLAYEYLEMGKVSGKIDMESLEADIKDIIEPHYGMDLGAVNVGHILLDVTVCASRHKISVGRDMMLLCKALITTEGMGHTLDPHFDLLHEMEFFSRTLMTHRYSPQRVIQESFWLLKDTSDLLRLLPRQLKQIFKKISTEEYLWHINLHSSDEKHNEMVRARHIQSLAMVMSAFLLTGALLLYTRQEPLLLGIPLLSWAAAAAALFLGMTAIFLFFRKR